MKLKELSVFRKLLNFITNAPKAAPEATSMPIAKPTDKITPHFTWKDALYLPQEKRMADVADGVDVTIIDNLKKLFQVLERIRMVLGDRPITVHVAYRSPAYNKKVKGAAKSAHLFGMAVDFSVKGLTCDEVRAKLVPMLDAFQIRMEDLPGSNWVHIDTRPTTGARFFKP